jgi:hypothetical protein
MRHSIRRTLAVLCVAGAMAAGFGVAPAAASDPLNVTLSCQPDANMCQAYASGGSGSYTFTWTNASEYYSEPGYSEAYPHCFDYVSGLLVRVKVTDGTGATDTAQWPMACNE